MGDRSPFPAGFCTVSLFIGGSWVPISLEELSADGVTITRAFSEAGQCSFRLKDPTGKWSPRHPSSPYFGLIGKGTPLKVETEVLAGSPSTRFYGEVVTFQPGWGRDGSRNAYVDVTAAGALRRIGAGALPLRSPLYRACSTLGSNLVAYWPMEDGSRAEGFAAAVGGRRATVAGTPNFATYDGVLGSDPLPTIESATFGAPVPLYTAGSPAAVQVRFMLRVLSTTPDGAVLARLILTGGTIDYFDVKFSNSDSGEIVVEAFADGASVNAFVTSGLNVEGRVLRISIELAQSGSNITRAISALEPGAATGGTASGSISSQTLGRITQVRVNPLSAALADVAFGHLTVEKAITSLFTVSSAVLAGHQGEQAHARIARLCAENGISYVNYDSATSQPMGPQTSKTLDELLRECVDADGGFRYEPRSVATELAYRGLRSLMSQTDVVTIPYQDNMLSPFTPVEDDAGTVNVSTVQRDAGSSATVEVVEGPLGTASGIGRYEDSQTLNLATDAQTEQRAGWISHVGTHDEARYPAIGWDFADPRILADSGLTGDLTSVTLGTQLEATGVATKLPWLPPFDVKAIVTGYTETIRPLSYRVDTVTTPARPYKVVVYGDTGSRYSLAGTVTAGTMTTTSTSRTMTVPEPGWTHADGDFDIVIGGEVMTVTDVTGTPPTQTFTLVRSVNGVVKTHAAGEAVELAEPAYLGI